MSDKQIKTEEIMKNFDFKKVHQIITFLDWKWYIDGEDRIPSIPELKSQARKMIEDAFDGICYSTGGFETENYKGLLTLKFCLEEWSG